MISHRTTANILEHWARVYGISCERRTLPTMDEQIYVIIGRIMWDSAPGLAMSLLSLQALYRFPVILILCLIHPGETAVNIPELLLHPVHFHRHLIDECVSPSNLPHPRRHSRPSHSYLHPIEPSRDILPYHFDFYPIFSLPLPILRILPILQQSPPSQLFPLERSSAVPKQFFHMVNGTLEKADSSSTRE